MLPGCSMTSMRALLALCLVVSACDAGSGMPVPASPDGAVDAADATGNNPDGATVPDASNDTSAPDVAVDVDTREGGGACSFNRDCIAAERCECDETLGCRCVPGARGTGRAGLDRCASGNDCASALCVEGTGGAMLCSDACTAAAECPAALPRCVNIASVGRFCARDPDAGVTPSDGGTVGPIALTARFGSATGAFDRAQHGTSGTDRVYIEAHFGGDPACPTMASPTPRRTLVISGLRATTAVQTRADGVSATLLDFAGELTSAPLLRATAVTVTPRTVDRGVSVSVEFSATFEGGTVTGTFTAPHCASLDD